MFSPDGFFYKVLYLSIKRFKGQMGDGVPDDSQARAVGPRFSGLLRKLAEGYDVEERPVAQLTEFIRFWRSKDNRPRPGSSFDLNETLLARRRFRAYIVMFTIHRYIIWRPTPALLISQ